MVRHGELVVEVDVELIYDGTGWEPYLSVEDVRRLSDVKLALQDGDVDMARRWGRVFRLVPIEP